ncbi:carboxypeptidase-like regulatory domain-containing protein [Candidatus Roizmanbacteria bacterium]|nr:carboxypeptidase-like regulatory domain-containing protein [Candidatus Roizmanbacteria bacterium]
MNAEGKVPVEFVNVGIVGKNVGTVSDINGRFSFFVDPKYDNDTVIFSIIGYKPQLIKVSALKKGGDNLVLLEERAYEMKEVIVRPRIFKQRTLGVTTKFKRISAGFKDNILGYECGILMNVKKSAFLKKVNINISNCSYDTIFYRVNIYKVRGKMDFENILREPIYLKMPRESVREGVVIDLASKNIVVDGDFLITLEHVKDLGPGNLYFCAGLGSKTYFRKTSQGKWETVPVGVSISVVADVEK